MLLMFYRFIYPVISILSCIIFLASCAAGINSEQKKAYRVYQEKEILVEKRKPLTAFKFGFLPGGSSFYNGDYDVGFFSLITWPVSIFWEVGSSKSRAMLINYRETERIIKKDFKKKSKALDDELLFGQITLQEYKQNISKLYQKYYNPYSLLLEKYSHYTFRATAPSKTTNSSLSMIDKKITNTCSKEFEILLKEVKSLDRAGFMHKCKISKRKSIIELGL